MVAQGVLQLERLQLQQQNNKKPYPENGLFALLITPQRGGFVWQEVKPLFFNRLQGGCSLASSAFTWCLCTWHLLFLSPRLNIFLNFRLREVYGFSLLIDFADSANSSYVEGVSQEKKNTEGKQGENEKAATRKNTGEKQQPWGKQQKQSKSRLQQQRNDKLTPSNAEIGVCDCISDMTRQRRQSPRQYECRRGTRHSSQIEGGFVFFAESEHCHECTTEEATVAPTPNARRQPDGTHPCQKKQNTKTRRVWHRCLFTHHSQSDRSRATVYSQKTTSHARPRVVFQFSLFSSPRWTNTPSRPETRALIQIQTS
jgi:hypothetical protein